MQRALSRLLVDELISEEDYRRAMIVSIFGDFIGNTDQHFGNLSFTWEQNSSRLNIAPFYDVLPMFYAPRSGGEILEDRFHSMPVRFPEEPDFYDSALPLAHEYWQILTADRRLSDSFRKIARGVQSRLPD